MKEIRLVQPSELYKDSFLELVAEVKKEGYETYDQYAKAEDDFEGFVEDLIKASKGINIEEGWAPYTTYWLVSDLALIGVIRIRHHVDTDELQMAGHIGYEIISKYRRRGFGTKILELGLRKAKKMGLSKVLITCDADNVGSKIIINKFGAQFIKKFVDDESGKDGLQYRISTDFRR